MRISCAIPRASFRSVFTVIALSAALTWRVSIKVAGSRPSTSPGSSHCARGPASRPMRVNRKPLSAKNATRASRSLCTFASLTICPAASTTHTLLHSNETSIAAKCSMAVPPCQCLGPITGPRSASPWGTAASQRRPRRRPGPITASRSLSEIERRYGAPGRRARSRRGSRRSRRRRERPPSTPSGEQQTGGAERLLAHDLEAEPRHRARRVGVRRAGPHPEVVLHRQPTHTGPRRGVVQERPLRALTVELDQIGAAEAGERVGERDLRDVAAGRGVRVDALAVPCGQRPPPGAGGGPGPPPRGQKGPRAPAPGARGGTAKTRGGAGAPPPAAIMPRLA